MYLGRISGLERGDQLAMAALLIVIVDDDYGPDGCRQLTDQRDLQ